MRSEHSGVLSTISVAMEGYPFGSIIPYIMAENGDIIIYASDIAQHSRNMKANPKVSICIYDAGQQDSQANARVTVVSTAEADNVSEALQQRYFLLFPSAVAYLQAHDFRFYRLRTERVRYIGGFGEIYWFSDEEWSKPGFPLAAQQQGAIEHMHADHADALAQIVNTFTDQLAAEGDVKMLSCFAEGFHCSVNDVIRFIAFNQLVCEEYDVRHAMVELIKEARQKSQS